MDLIVRAYNVATGATAGSIIAAIIAAHIGVNARSGKAIVSQRNHKLKPGPMAETSFINGARAKIVHWGKVPR